MKAKTKMTVEEIFASAKGKKKGERGYSAVIKKLTKNPVVIELKEREKKFEAIILARYGKPLKYRSITFTNERYGDTTGYGLFVPARGETIHLDKNFRVEK